MLRPEEPSARLLKANIIEQAQSSSTNDDFYYDGGTSISQANASFDSFGGHENVMISYGLKPGTTMTSTKVLLLPKHSNRTNITSLVILNRNPRPNLSSIQRKDQEMNPALEEDDEDNEEADYDSYDDDEVGPSLYNSFSRYDNFAHSYELEL